MDKLYYVAGGGAPYFYHLDGLGFVRAMTDTRTPTHRVKMYEEYEAFGNEGYSNRYVEQHFKYDGEYRDEDSTGYIYLRARFYDPTIGRFFTRDPYYGSITHPLSLNQYAFTENNPVSRSDPSGLWYIDVNVGAGYIIGVSGGILLKAEGWYPYFGGGLTTPGTGFSVMGSIDNPNEGWSIGVQGSNIFSVQLSKDLSEEGNVSSEFGIGSPGLSAMGSYTFSQHSWQKPQEVKPKNKK